MNTLPSYTNPPQLNTGLFTTDSLQKQPHHQFLFEVGVNRHDYFDPLARHPITRTGLQTIDTFLLASFLQQHNYTDLASIPFSLFMVVHIQSSESTSLPSMLVTRWGIQLGLIHNWPQKQF